MRLNYIKCIGRRNIIDTKEMFNDLFGSYLSQEEVLERINDYLDEIEFVEEVPYSEGSDGLIGLYNYKEKKVYVKIMDIESEKSVYFHEMVHVLHEKLNDELGEEFIKELECQ